MVQRRRSASEILPPPPNFSKSAMVSYLINCLCVCVCRPLSLVCVCRRLSLVCCVCVGLSLSCVCVGLSLSLSLSMSLALSLWTLTHLPDEGKNQLLVAIKDVFATHIHDITSQRLRTLHLYIGTHYVILLIYCITYTLHILHTSISVSIYYVYQYQ